MQRVVQMLAALGSPAFMSEASRDLLGASYQSGLTAHFNHQAATEQDAVIGFLTRFYEAGLSR
jgi:hypothetical protein